MKKNKQDKINNPEKYHPKLSEYDPRYQDNGIVSFGEDDFIFLRNNQDITELVATNKVYTYSTRVLQNISEIPYSEIYRNSFEFLHTDDFEPQHGAFLFLSKKDMWNMNGKELTKLQERQIEKLKEQWFAELDALEKKKRPLPKNVFSMDYNRERIKLAEKYLPLIKKIMSENEGNTDCHAGKPRRLYYHRGKWGEIPL